MFLMCMSNIKLQQNSKHNFIIPQHNILGKVSTGKAEMKTTVNYCNTTENVVKVVVLLLLVSFFHNIDG